MYPYQRVYTDEEANLREAEKFKETLINCLFCIFFSTQDNKCSKGHNVTDCQKQVCDEWRYVV